MHVYTSDGSVGVVEVGAIGDVATATSHRRRGLAARVLQDAHAYMDAAGCVFISM